MKLVKKGVYLFEYMDSFEMFSGNKLPDRSKFLSSLKEKFISKKDYLHTNTVCNMFEMIQWVIIVIFI